MVRSKIVFQVIFLLLSMSLTVLYCKKREVIGTSDEEAQTILEARKIELSAKIKDHYDIQGASISPEAAVRLFFQAIADGRAAENPYAFSESEYLNIYWPNNPPVYTMNLGLSPDRSWLIEKLGRDALTSGLADKLGGRKIELLSIQYARDPVKFNALNILTPAMVVVRAGTEIIRFEIVRVIVEHDGKFKVCSYRHD